MGLAAPMVSPRIAFRQINKQTGNRLRQQLVDDETGDVVETADKGRGYESGRHAFMMVEDEELEAVAIETSRTIDIDSFVPPVQIDESTAAPQSSPTAEPRNLAAAHSSPCTTCRCRSR